MRKTKFALTLLHLLVAFLAFLGRWAAISEPMGPFGISTDLLAHSPFKTFLIPGLLLFLIIGLGQLAAAAFLLLRSRYQSYVSFFFSGVLMVWLLVQVGMIRTIKVMHVVTFVIACIQMALSLRLMYKEKRFPTELVMRFLQCRKHA